MDNINAITQFISSVGFPIAMSCAMVYIVYTSLNKMTNAINELKSAIEIISDRLDRLEK